MAARRVRRTPKVFHSSYQPPRSINWSQYRSLRPLIWLAVAVVALFLFLRLPVFAVREIGLTGDASPVIAEKIERLKGQSIFSGGLTRAIERIGAEDLIVESFDCRRGIPSTLRCEIKLREPAFIWKQPSGEFLMDKNGVLYQVRNGEAALVIEDRGNQPVKIGQTVVTSDIVTTYKKIEESLTAEQLEISQFFLNETLYQLGVILSKSNNPELPFAKQPISVFFAVNNPADGQIKTLKEILKTKHDQITERVDLRVPGYAYFK